MIGDEHIVKNQCDNRVDESAALLTKDIQFLKNDNNDDETMVDNNMVQMVNDVYQYFNENPNVNCENGQASSMEEMNDIDHYQKLIKDAKTPLYPSCSSFNKLSDTMKL